MQRSVRQAGRLLDKEVSLSIEGAGTLIDGTILNNLTGPLMHLLRNAVDHGVEGATERRSANKPANGAISLKFSREGNFIVIHCEDDGTGLDLPRIRAAALEKGLIVADQVLTDNELARTILQPGFSTRSQATQVSGRGVGLDVVNTSVLSLKDSLREILNKW